MDKKLIILQDLKNHISEHLGKEIVNVILFGSQAKNTALQESDYDVLIILKSKPDWKKKDEIIDLCYDINLKHEILIDPHILGVEEINSIRGRQPVFANAYQNGIRV